MLAARQTAVAAKEAELTELQAALAAREAALAAQEAAFLVHDVLAATVFKRFVRYPLPLRWEKAFFLAGPRTGQGHRPAPARTKFQELPRRIGALPVGKPTMALSDRQDNFCGPSK